MEEADEAVGAGLDVRGEREDRGLAADEDAAVVEGLAGERGGEGHLRRRGPRRRRGRRGGGRARAGRGRRGHRLGADAGAAGDRGEAHPRGEERRLVGVVGEDAEGDRVRGLLGGIDEPQGVSRVGADRRRVEGEEVVERMRGVRPADVHAQRRRARRRRGARRRVDRRPRRLPAPGDQSRHAQRGDRCERPWSAHLTPSTHVRAPMPPGMMPRREWQRGTRR